MMRAATAFAVLAALALGACAPGPGDAPRSAKSATPSGEEVYTQGPRSRGGIGVYYMGREIAGVMSHLGAGWLDRPEREQEERTDLVIENMDLARDDAVADIGAGSGYFTLRLARAVPEGRVFAVDIQPEMLAIVRLKAEEAALDNIVPVQATETSLELPPESIDVALLVDAYHEFRRPLEVMQQLRAALRPGGRVVLLEYREEDPDVPIIPVHKMSERQARAELEAAGFAFVENGDFLPRQHFLVFRKP